MMKRTPATQPATIAPTFTPSPPPPLFDPPLSGVEVAVLPSALVYVMGFPVARGPAVAVLMGAVIVAPPFSLPPTTSMTAWGTV